MECQFVEAQLRDIVSIVQFSNTVNDFKKVAFSVCVRHFLHRIECIGANRFDDF